ncbi:hypothetical protein ACHAPU_009134 [Fusarium lateritium]
MVRPRLLSGYTFRSMGATPVTPQMKAKRARIDAARDVVKAVRASRDATKDEEKLRELEDQRDRIFAVLQRSSKLSQPMYLSLCTQFLPLVIGQICTLEAEIAKWKEDVAAACRRVDALLWS